VITGRPAGSLLDFAVDHAGDQPLSNIPVGVVEQFAHQFHGGRGVVVEHRVQHLDGYVVIESASAIGMSSSMS
jgi:hypothetical protein